VRPGISCAGGYTLSASALSSSPTSRTRCISTTSNRWASASPIRPTARESSTTSPIPPSVRASPSISRCSTTTTRSSRTSNSAIVRAAKRHDPDAFHRLRSVPGIGKILALTILYEVHDISRFDRVQQFASYARLVKCAHESAGKKLGTGGAKQGNVHLKWAFSEAAVTFLRHCADGKKLLARIERKHGKGKALSILAHKLGRTVYYMLARKTVFSFERFMHV
jgi:hypothetical protein